MDEKPILIIHPNDTTTIFLNRIKHHLTNNFGELTHHFNIYPNELSHQSCLEKIRQMPNNGLIIFLGHGRSDKLYGAKGKKYNAFVSPDSIQENPDEYYYNEDFINTENVSVFEGKKIFCLACNSNSKIAQTAVLKGAKSFLGFGDIPTSYGEFKEKGIEASTDLVIKLKSELNYIIKKSLFIGIDKDLSFEELLNVIKLITNQRLTDILINQKKFKERYILADYLYFFKKEAIVVGQKKLKLLG